MASGREQIDNMISLLSDCRTMREGFNLNERRKAIEGIERCGHALNPGKQSRAWFSTQNLSGFAASAYDYSIPQKLPVEELSSVFLFSSSMSTLHLRKVDASVHFIGYFECQKIQKYPRVFFVSIFFLCCYLLLDFS